MLKPPSLDHLSRSATHQRCWPKKVSDEHEVIPDLEEAEEKSEDDDSQSVNSKEPAKKRVKCNSMHHNAKPTQLRFYPGAWQDVLEDVKEFYRLWAIKECPFPIRECYLLHALPCLERAMEEFEKKGREVKAGMSISTFISHSHEYG